MGKAGKILGTLAVFVVIIFAGGIGKVVGKIVSQNFSNGEKSAALDFTLTKTANKINKNLPVMVDKYTRLDSTMGLNKIFQYNYTMIANSAADFDKRIFQTKFAPVLKNKVCSTDSTRLFLKRGITVEYKYRGKYGNSIGTVSVSPAQCGY